MSQLHNQVVLLRCNNNTTTIHIKGPMQAAMKQRLALMMMVASRYSDDDCAWQLLGGAACHCGPMNAVRPL
jgi:hypothetical protein